MIWATNKPDLSSIKIFFFICFLLVKFYAKWHRSITTILKDFNRYKIIKTILVSEFSSQAYWWALQSASRVAKIKYSFFWWIWHICVCVYYLCKLYIQFQTKIILKMIIYNYLISNYQMKIRIKRKLLILLRISYYRNY